MRLCAVVIAMASLLAAGSFPRDASSQTASARYPSQVIHLVVPFTPGASTDLTARLFAQHLSAALGQQVIIENRGGAGGGIGADMVAKAEPDGYTLLASNQGPFLQNALLRKDAPFTVGDFAPVAFIGYSPLIVVANLSFPASDVKELVSYAKANPGKVTLGSSGTNGNLHVAIEMLKAATSANVVHVPYRGTGPSLNDVVAGTISGAFTTTVSAEGLISSGKVKVLGVAGPERMAVIPNVPTFREQGITDADAEVWIGIVAPAKTPRAVVDVLNREINKALAASDTRARFAQWGLEAGAGGTPEDFRAVIQREVERIQALIKSGALTVQ
ncbi:MAG: tripartite tricarboxylate transporter substrate binding protein [Hyphomicrobiales bacterium]|nr:tripartite tricarboxylate transporter substrate binding protein [Hyphomicrobiales bacterium]